MIALTTSPNESATMIIEIEFLDVDGAAFTPKTCAWTLSDAKGTIINNRSRVAASVTGTSHNFVLTGADLAYAVGLTKGRRVFTVEGTYDSIYGANLSYREERSFEVVNTVIDAQA